MFKGTRNNKGRPKGSPNKSTKLIRDAIKDIIEGHIESLEHDLSTLQAKDRVRFIIDLMAFVLPRMKQVEDISDKDDFAPVTIISLGSGITPNAPVINFTHSKHDDHIDN